MDDAYLDSAGSDRKSEKWGILHLKGGKNTADKAFNCQIHL